MSDPSGLPSDPNEEIPLLPAGAIAEPQSAAKKKPEESSGADDGPGEDPKEEEEDLVEDGAVFAHLEPSTLPWPGDGEKRSDPDDGVWSEGGDENLEEGEVGGSGGSQDLSGEQSQTESDRKSKARWRESMPEGERWRNAVEVQGDDKGDGSLADDEEEEEEEDAESHWMTEKAAMGFTPQVTIVRPSSKDPPDHTQLLMEKDEKESQMEPQSPELFHRDWPEQDNQHYLSNHVCSEKVKLALATAVAAVLFPLLVWAGYALLPFDSPLLESAPLRVMYTLRCSFFAIIPIVLGVLVQGVARLRYGDLMPLFQTSVINREVAVHWHFVNESLALFLFYFLQLAVMATYVSQDLVKLVPLLTIVFVFGRLIYWLCLALGSSIRGLGFGFSFFPMLVMLGANLYFVCSSVGQAAVFDVEPPTTAPPRRRWWG